MMPMRTVYIARPPYESDEDIYIEVIAEDEQHAYKLFTDRYRGLYGVEPIEWKAA